MTESADNKSKSDWHWQEGNKYAHEGIKTIAFLNGGAAVALVTFNQHKPFAFAMLCALGCFGLGAALAATSFILAYYTQLSYGNAELPGADRQRLWAQGQWLNIAAGAVVFSSIVMSLIGLFIAAFSAQIPV